MNNNLDWKANLSPEQEVAALHIGNHARLLAGPGTGKTRTLTHRVLALVLEHKVDPNSIIAITFTRVAAFQLHHNLQEMLAPQEIDIPRVSTLHSFALRQLLINAEIVDALPMPLRIADDWEERYIIEEDIKRDLNIQNIKDVRILMNQLSADWETLEYEEERWQETFPNPRFVGAWTRHRRIFGYTLRSELVYQLKRSLNQYPDFQLESEFRHLLVDEYQDLNACDFSVITELVNRGLELFAAGDDDQSIYGFRYATPERIRNFVQDFPGAEELSLETCYRCDRSILRLAEYIAGLDVERLPKNTIAANDANEGEINLMSFQDQYEEVRWISDYCQNMMAQGLLPSDILILLRSDRYEKISNVFIEILTAAGLPVSKRTGGSILDSEEGRNVLAHLKIIANNSDSLAWRAILQLDKTNQIGPKKIDSIRALSQGQGVSFSEMLSAVNNDTDLLPKHGGSVSKAYRRTLERIAECSIDNPGISELCERVCNALIDENEPRTHVLRYLEEIIIKINNPDLDSLLQSLGTSLDIGEQELDPDSINILTMHQAKGLSADTVIISGVEDEFIPGGNEGEGEGDERRLLYVSMTRAKHRLVMTYCQRRIDIQRFTGSRSPNSRRTLSRFLRNAPIEVEQA